MLGAPEKVAYNFKALADWKFVCLQKYLANIAALPPWSWPVPWSTTILTLGIVQAL